MTLNCRGELISLEKPRVMGILNLTPDSFYDGGRYQDMPDILMHTEKMLEEGASFIDLGAYSSRPGAEDISEEMELSRLGPAVEAIRKRFPEALLSVDTFRSRVASHCLDRGVAMINDISAGQADTEMMAVVAKYQVPFIMMHMKGSPQDMADHAHYRQLIQEMVYYFSGRLREAHQHGICDCIVDPGFGFAKNREHNIQVLDKLESFKILGKPILVGLSRKSMIYRLLEQGPGEALNGSTALHAIALVKGANILRVHDVKEAVECVKLIGALGE